ncbi:MAG: hypothetical protein ABR596_07110 [Halarsenatibacteraceae bacterium]
MRLNKKMILGMAIVFLGFIFTVSIIPAGTVNAVSRTELEDQVNQALSNFTGNSEILKSILSDRISSNETESSIDEYLQSSELVNLRVSDDGDYDVINDNEIEVYTYLVVEIETGSGDRDLEIDITVMLREIDNDWTIAGWELGHRDSEDKHSGSQYRHDVDRLLDDIFAEIISGNTSNLYNYLGSDFEYEGPALDGNRTEVDLERREFISVLDEIFAEGRDFSTLKFEDRSYDIDDDEVELEGVVTMIGRNSDGSRFINLKYNAELEFEKENGVWYLKEWKED